MNLPLPHELDNIYQQPKIVSGTHSNDTFPK